MLALWHLLFPIIRQCRYQSYSHAHFVSPDDKGDLAAPRVDKTGPAGVQYDVFPVPCTETDGWVVKWLPCILKNCRENQNDSKIRTGTERKKVCLHRFNPEDSLFLCIPNMMGRSLGCRWRRTGVPIKSWGRYPRRGTALRNTKRAINHSVKPDSSWRFSSEVRLTSHPHPEIHNLECVW